MKKSIITVFIILISISAYSQQLKLMTYNIRYENETDGADSWSKRKDLLAGELKFYEPDIFGVQEAVNNQMEFIKFHLSGYDYLGVGRDNGKTKGEYSAIFYKKEKFKVLDSDTFWLSKTPKKPSKDWDAAYPRICTYALFQDKDTKQRFWVFNTHFDHIGDVAREESAKLIISKIQELNKKNYPVFLSGDFNLEPNSDPIQYISKYMKQSKQVSEKVSFGPDGTFNNFDFNKPVTRRIDYIFVSETGISVLKYAVLSDNKNLHYPSDHLPVFILAELK